ncbi:GNAT family N-acetyltransferase [Planosporangium sp. 12N6]|uniref:GNAT family N-acetyltransferase n=1 Tax=Planosporangium spinosum TaxID=3402278 RepID=UPI003CE73548
MAGDFLHARAAANTLPLTIAETLGTSGVTAYGGDSPLLGWWRPERAAVAGVFVHTPPYPAVVTRLPGPAVPSLAEHLAALGRPLSGVNGDREVAEAFAAEWVRRTGGAVHLHQQHRLYRLADLTPPRPAPPGHARIAGTADLDLVLAWWEEFVVEVGDTPSDRTNVVADRIGHGGVLLWEVNGAPVAMAGVTRPVAGMVRVGPVYTPPRLRGRGYAGAVTAAVSRAARTGGAAEVLLFADLANPTSNGLYQRLGYRPVGDHVILSFVGGSAVLGGA